MFTSTPTPTSTSMHLHTAAAEVPGFSRAQLEQLARNVEARRVQLEADINAYIARKQDELRRHETELIDTLRAMERDGDNYDDVNEPQVDDDDNIASTPSTASRRSSAASLDDHQRTTEAKEAKEAKEPSTKKPKKQGRVHKREKELYGLVTPVFLPLLDARESTSPEKPPKKVSREPPTAKHADSTDSTDSTSTTTTATTTTTTAAMAPDPPAKERAASDPVKKRRSSIKKKSALRHSSTGAHSSTSTTSHTRKRVSLVIDDQVVRPSDTIQEPALTSPTSDSTSATASTASLDDMIDPRLTSDAPVYIEHHDALHHSLPVTTSTTYHPSPIKPTSPIKSPAKSPAEPAHIPYAPPSYATRSFLDPPPDKMPIEDLPTTAGPSPLYPSTLDADPEDRLAAQHLDTTHDDDDGGFQTYVGGISGSGVDDVNQVGSVGYPSSLGASYLESYMQGRPLRVRMAAAEQGGDAEEMRQLRGLEERRRKRETEERGRAGAVVEDEWSVPAKGGEDDDFMGSMDDF